MEEVNEQEIQDTLEEVFNMFKSDSDLSHHLIRSGYLMHSVATVIRTVGLSDAEKLKRIKKYANEHLYDSYLNVSKKSEEELNSEWFKDTFLIKVD